MLGSRKAKLPAMNAFILSVSKLSPMPTLNVPAMMVTFSLWMPMWRDAEPIGHFQANCEVTCGGGRVAFEHGELRAWAHDRRRRPPRNGIGSECVCFVRMIIRGNCEKRACATQQSRSR